MSDDWDDELDGEQADTDDDETLVVACPSCGADVYEDAEQCPACDEYIVHDTRVWGGMPIWWIAPGVVGVAAAIAVLSGLC